MIFPHVLSSRIFRFYLSIAEKMLPISDLYRLSFSHQLGGILDICHNSLSYSLRRLQFLFSNFFAFKPLPSHCIHRFSPSPRTDTFKGAWFAPHPYHIFLCFSSSTTPLTIFSNFRFSRSYHLNIFSPFLCF